MNPPPPHDDDEDDDDDDFETHDLIDINEDLLILEKKISDYGFVG